MRLYALVTLLSVLPLIVCAYLVAGGLRAHEQIHGQISVGLPDRPVSAPAALPQVFAHGAAVADAPRAGDAVSAEPGRERMIGEQAFTETEIFQLESIEAGNTIEGPAIVEHSATTFAISPGRRARLDGHQIFHLTNTKGSNDGDG